MRGLTRRAASAALLVLVAAGCESAPPRVDPADASVGTELRDFGERCDATEDCASGLCLEVAPGLGVCTRTCSGPAECPPAEPWGCVTPHRFGARVCGCTADSETERCGDGIDNDCDGAVDDCRICDGVPVPEDSNAHCGACSRACRADQECSGGECRCATPGSVDCGGRCVDRTSDDAHCGACGAACSSDRSCVEGVCDCRADRPDTCSVGGTTVCVDHASDESHCGGCGRRCPTGQICIAGECSCPDTTDVDHCGGVGCVDLTSDTAHCGACERACRAGEVCVGSSCRCPLAGQTWCDGRCVDTSNDLTSCGACGIACRAGERCIGGSCVCDSGLVCGGVCTPHDDPAHCGACGVACRADQRCTGGTCRCTSGVECGGACVDTLRDGTNCGACGVTCGPDRVCSSGVCACPYSGQRWCAETGTCAYLSSDEASCGACGVACGVGQECVSGTCRCPAGTTWCDAAAACVDLSRDRESCGTCGNVCAPGLTCSSYACQCPVAGESYCPATGTCEPLATDPQNCGACGNVCPAATTCSAGRCACPTPGQTYCASVDACIDLATSPQHCGACDAACVAVAVCSAGACACPTAGETVCGEICVDLADDPAHCGACESACTGGRTCTGGACWCPVPTPGPVTRWTSDALDDERHQLASDASSRVAMVWRQSDSSDCCAVTFRFALFDLDGTRVVPDRILASSEHGGGVAAVAWNGVHWGVAWAQEHADGGQHVYFQRFDAAGVPIEAASDVSAHWSSHPDVWVLEVAWSATSGWALLVRGSLVQLLGLDASARPLPAYPFVSGSGSLAFGYDLIGLPEGGFGFVESNRYFEVNPDGSITRAPVRIGAELTSGSRLLRVRLVWDGEAPMVAAIVDSTVQVRRGPTFSEVHTVATESAALSALAIDVRDGRATLAWARGTSNGILRAARVALPVGGASFAALTPATTIMGDSTVVLGSIESVQVVQPTASRALAAWMDTRWGQRELYAVPLDLGACR